MLKFCILNNAMYCTWLRTNAISPQLELTKLYDATADNPGAIQLPSAPTQPLPPSPLFSQSYRLEAETGHFSIPHLLPFVNFLSRILGPPAGDYDF